MCSISLEINKMKATMTLSARTSARGFTLIELLVVIAIIAILAAMVTPAINGAMQRAKKAQVMTELQALKTAIQAYYNDYSKLPIAAGHGGADTTYDGTSSPGSKDIIKVLTGNDNTLNPRKIVYLETATPSSDGTFLDVWRGQYVIKLDNDYDGKVDGYSTLVITMSGGPDKNIATTNDNIRSTQ